MSRGKEFSLYTHKGGSHGWRVALLLEELGLTYQTIYLGEKWEHTKLHPNEFVINLLTTLGMHSFRLISSIPFDYIFRSWFPILVVHKNSNYTLRGVHSILEYLVNSYDKEREFSVTKPGEKYLQLEIGFQKFLFFQGSRGGPYFGQIDFNKKVSYPHKFPQANKPYEEEVKQAFESLERILSHQEWLLGEKYTIADLCFIPWHNFAAHNFLNDLGAAEKYPAVYEWFKKVTERPAVEKVLAEYELVKLKRK